MQAAGPVGLLSEFVPASFRTACSNGATLRLMTTIVQAPAKANLGPLDTAGSAPAGTTSDSGDMRRERP
ncbi:hypothetical protein GCM10009608_63190 [Pseudonocardia alaniniphila]